MHNPRQYFFYHLTPFSSMSIEYLAGIALAILAYGSVCLRIDRALDEGLVI